MSKNKHTIGGPLGVRAEAAIYFVDDQFLFHGLDNRGAEQIKFVSSATVREAFSYEPLDSGWLPPGVVRYGVSSRGTWMVRWHAPGIYKVRLAGRKTPLTVPMPALIWVGLKHNYYIFAAREPRLTPKAVLHRAPLANVNHHGLICFGKEEHPDVARGGFDLAWNTFWQSEFNDDHDNGKSRRHPDAVNAMLTELSRAKAKSYPQADLVSMNVSLDAAIKQIARRDNESGGNDE